MKILLIARQRRHAKPGGLVFLADAWELDLRERGFEVVRVDCAGAVERAAAEGVSLTLHIGDTERIVEHAQIVERHSPGSVFAVNAQLTGLHVRTRNARARVLDLADRAPLLRPRGIVFSDWGAEAMQGLGVKMPHAWRTIDGFAPVEYADRDGVIIIGDLAKSCNPRISGAFPLDDLKTLRGIVTAYEQYGGAEAKQARRDHLWIRVEKYRDGDEFLRRLAWASLFVHVGTRETWGMPACEAAALGTPVLHLPMAQSLDEAIPSGRMAEEFDLALRANHLLDDEWEWTRASVMCRGDVGRYRESNDIGEAVRKAVG